MSRARRGRRFPYYDLNIANEIIQKIKMGGVERLESMTLAKALNHKSDSSSTFKAKISSAKHYGLVVETKEEINEKRVIFYIITDLGKKIATPINPSEKLDSLRLSFLNCDLWKEVYENYEEIGKLPERSTLENVFERTYDISPVSKALAYDSFVNSGKVAGLFEERDDGIFYSKNVVGEKTKKERDEEVAAQISPNIRTNINVTIEVDTKDDTSVKNFISLLEALQKIQKQSR